MVVEFYYNKNHVFTKPDLVNIDGIWKPIEDISNNEAAIVMADFSDNPETKTTLRRLKSLGVKENIEFIMAISRRYFTKLTRQPDIEETGKLNIEVR